MPNLIESSDPLLGNLDFDNLGVGEQAQVNALALVATEWIERVCNRTFRKTVYTDETHDGNGELWIYIRNAPIITLTQVTIQESNFSGDSVSTDFAASKFDIKESSGKIRFKPNSFLASTTGLFSAGFQNILIDYTGGYIQVPEPIRLVASQFIMEMFDPSSIPQNIEKEKLGNYFLSKGVNYFSNLTFNTKQILNSYKQRRVRV